MRAARSKIVAIAMLATGSGLAWAQLQPFGPASAADPLRDRAEDLAEAASRRFSEIMKDERGTQPRGREPSVSPRGEDPWSAALKWLDRSNSEYKTMLRRLSQASDPAAGPSMRATKPEVPPAPVAGIHLRGLRQ